MNKKIEQQRLDEAVERFRLALNASRNVGSSGTTGGTKIIKKGNTLYIALKKR